MKTLVPIKEPATVKDRLLNALIAAGEKGLTVAELIKGADTTRSGVWTAVSAHRDEFGIKNLVTPGQRAVRYALAGYTMSPSMKQPTPALEGPTAPSSDIESHEPAAVVTRKRAKYQTSKTKEYYGYMDQIMKVAAEVAVFNSRELTPRECFIMAEAQVLTSAGHPELIKNPVRTSLIENFDERFGGAYTTLVDEMMKKPEPVVKEVIPKDLSVIPDELFFAEVGIRFAKVMHNIKTYSSPPVPAAPSVPLAISDPVKSVPQVDLRPIRLAVVGLLDSQHQAIQNYPPIQRRMSTGMLELEFTHKDAAKLAIRQSCEGAVVLAKLDSHKTWDSIRAQVGKENVITGNGTTQLREGLMNIISRLEKARGWLPKPA